jgi:transposase
MRKFVVASGQEVKHMKRLMLTLDQQHCLERQLQETQEVRVYRRTFAVLEFSRGRSIAQIAEALGVTRQSIYNWVEQYASTYDPSSLREGDRPGRPSALDEEDLRVLTMLLTTDPDRHGYAAVNWTVPLLQNTLEREIGRRVSDDTIRRELQRHGYVWKRPRYVLAPDPEREKKTLDSASSPATAA